MIHIRVEDLPEVFREQLAEIWRALNSAPAEGYDGTVEASIASMTDQQVAGIIEGIVRIGTAVNLAQKLQ